MESDDDDRCSHAPMRSTYAGKGSERVEVENMKYSVAQTYPSVQLFLLL